MKTVILLALALVASASAQSVSVSQPTKEVAGVATVTISYAPPRDDFKPTKCAWYSIRAALVLIHEGCDSFSREFTDGAHSIVLIADGHTGRSQYNEQRAKLAEVDIQPRVAVINRPFDVGQLQKLKP